MKKQDKIKKRKIFLFSIHTLHSIISAPGQMRYSGGYRGGRSRGGGGR